MRQKNEDDVVEIDLSRLMHFYISHWKSVFLGGVLAALIAFLITFFLITPQFRAGVTIYVNNTKNAQPASEITGSNLSAAQKLVSTYINIIKSNTVLTEVIEKGNLDYSIEEVRNLMSAKQIEDTEMFSVTISHPDPEVAAHIANTIAEVAPERISGFVEGSSAKIIDYAELPVAPYTPDYKKNIVLGALLGCILVGILLTLKYLFNVRLHNEDDMELYFADIPVLGVIPELEQSSHKKRSGKKTKSKGGR